MKKSLFSPFPVFVLALLGMSSLLLGFARPQQAPGEEVSSASLQVALGRDSPNLGGNTFRDAFISMTVSSSEGIQAGKVVNEISFPDNGEVDFERGELTPDAEAAGGTFEVERLEPAAGMKRVRVTIDGSGKALPSGIVANLVFKVLKEFSLEEVGTEEHLIMLENSVTAWAPDEKEIAEVGADAGSIDLAYAPVVFACFFYMH